MNSGTKSVLYTSLLIFGLAVTSAFAADDTKLLLGSWTGRATGPEGGPPTGDIIVTFDRDESRALKGKIVVKAPGGVQYSGQVSNIALRKKVFTATAIFKLGENPLEASVSGPLKGKTIQGNFIVTVKNEKIGEGTFSITKDPAVTQAK